MNPLRTILPLAVVLLLALPTSSGAAPTYKFAAQLLRALPSEEETTTPAYARAKFKHWVAIGRTGCNARQYVLWQENLRRPKPACSSRAGSWKSAYDGIAFAVPGSLDIDHMIPLAEAWRSGAATKWDAATRQAFANDVTYGHSLIAVSAATNRSKGDKDPSAWMPPLAGFRCAYAVRWVAVKYRWKLAVNAAERVALTTAFEGCPRSVIRIPTPAQARITNVPPPPPPPTTDDGGDESGGGSGYPVQPDQEGDQDCSDFSGPVQVLPGDPDGLDGDGDGIGCE